MSISDDREIVQGSDVIPDPPRTFMQVLRESLQDVAFILTLAVLTFLSFVIYNGSNGKYQISYNIVNLNVLSHSSLSSKLLSNFL